MKQHKLSGTGVALVTPFNADASIDYPALEKIINHVIVGGVDFIVSLGTTGEAITLSAKECRAVFDFTIEQVNGRVPVVAGLFGGNYTEKIAASLREYNFDGFAAVMSSNPAYSKPSQEGIFRHYMTLAEACPLPLIIYNVPGRTSSNVEAVTTLRLAHASAQFLAVKEASGDVVQAMQILKGKPEHFQLWSGDDLITLPLIAAGASGVVSVIANAYPGEFSAMVHAARQGDFMKARQLNELLLDIHPWLYVDGNPPGIKSALDILGLCSPAVRIPLTPASEATCQALKREMEKVAKSPLLAR
jgi:4-hydroxy-tetrahydrodipicolinate synthase